ncbi:hypothetical protein LXL04_006511 [Taraxacum kok-saghyz]
MEVVMSSPVHEPSRTENTGSNDKSQKNNLRMKKKKLLLKSNAENPEIKQQLHQNNPTATVDQKHELSSPEIQHHMVTHTKSMISGETSTSDANTLSERESHAKVSNGEIGSSTPATATTVSNKNKNPSSTDNQSVHETTKTQDIVAVTNNSSTPTPTDVVKVSNKIKKKKKKKNPESVNIQSVHDTTQTQDTVAVTNKSSTTTTTPTPTPTDVVKKKKKKKKNPESVNIQSVQETTQTQEIVPVTNQSSTTTPTDVVKKKKKKKKNPESVNIQSVHDTTQTHNTVSVTNKGSSTPPTDEKMAEKKNNPSSTDIQSVHDTTQTQDTVAVTNKSSTTTTTPTPTDVVKKKKKKKKNPESVNIQSVHDTTQTQNIVSVTNISSSTPPTSDANTLSNGESHAKVSDSEIGSCTPATATTISKKRKNPSSSDIQSVHNTTQTQEIVPVTNQSSTTTLTDVVKVSNEKRKKKKKKKKNPESVNIQSVQETTQTHDTVAVTNKISTTTPTLTPTDVVKVSTKKRKKKNPESVDIQSVHDNTQTQEIVPVTNQSSTTTPTDVVKKKKKKKKKNPESVNIQSVHETTQTQNIVSVTNKSSSTPPTSDANTLSNGDSNVTNELASRSENKKKQKVSDDDANAKSDEQMERKRKKKKKEREEDVTVHEPGFVKGERITKPTIGEILKPGYLEEPEKAEERRALSKQMSKKNKSVKIADLVNLDSPSQTEVKPRDDKIMEKKLLIFDVNGLLGDIVSPSPKDMVADKYIPKRAIFKRPFLDDFLRFCFERFHVGIWSSRTHKVLDPAVYCLLGNLKKNLLFIWDNSFCTKTKMKTLENKHKPVVFKDLRKIWDKSWWKGPFHESNTLLIDDSPYKALLNPKNTGIFPLSYCYKDMNDNSLGPNGDLRTYLEGLANSDDVKTYVDQHPFGQPALDETHPHWSFYSRALNSQRSKLAVHVNQRRVQF